MEQKVITFKQAFETLNKIGDNSLFNFDGEKIISLNNKIKLIFIDSLFGPLNKFSSTGLLKIPKKELIENIKSNFEQHLSKNFVFIYNPTYYQGGKIKHSADNAIVEFSKQFGDDTKICIQQDNREYPPRRSFLISTEELGELITMLYFREKGYIVQSPLGTCGREGDNKP